MSELVHKGDIFLYCSLYTIVIFHFSQEAFIFWGACHLGSILYIIYQPLDYTSTFSEVSAN